MIRTATEAVRHVAGLTPLPAEYLEYTEHLLTRLYSVADLALSCRSLGRDPSTNVECEIAFDLADRVEHLLKVPVSTRLRELLTEFRTERAAMVLAEEVALGRFGFLDKEQALDTGVRVGLAVVTDGITVAPLQGVSSVRIKKNEDGTDYAAVYFAGPIRSAGGTEAAFTLVIADHLRRVLGLDNYRPNGWGDDEVGRFVEELRTYERDVGNFQFRVSDEDVQNAILRLPVEIDGVETDPVEVVVHRGLRRIETDRVRGGALRVLNDGLIGRSRKLLKLLEDLSVKGWDWLAELGGGRQHGVEETRAEGSHFEEVISGRPVLSFPGHAGGFRLRYGRCYNTGLSTVGIHPATAALLDYPFVAGTQVKVDIPGKAATVAFVDSIEAPIVRLRDESVIRVESVAQAVEVRNSVEKVLFLGDVLVSFGDFLENNVALRPSGYVEEWWCQEVGATIRTRYETVESAARAVGVPVEHLDSFCRGETVSPSLQEAFLLSDSLQVGLHPRFLFYWDLASASEILTLKQSLVVKSAGLDSCLITASNRPEVKASLERVGIPHQVDGDTLVLEGETAYVVMKTLGLVSERAVVDAWRNVPELLSLLAGVPIRRKSSAFVGLRIGRPEKAMPRRMKPPVHLLFPVGKSGGAMRDLLEAGKSGNIEVELINLVCTVCGEHAVSARCNSCGGETRVVKTCPSCGRVVELNVCPACKVAGIPYSQTSFPLQLALKRAIQQVKFGPAPPLKGVRGLTNAARVCEPLEKGVLRRKYDLSIYKDSTVRFDVTNVPLTHFKPRQIGTSIMRLRELGYVKDTHGEELVSEDQLVELFVQDVVLPVEAGEYLVQVAAFLDDLLADFYGRERYYHVRSVNDLVGHLIVGLAPHTSVGIIGRVLGFTNAQVCFAHPYWHSAKRRDCDGDQDAVMLLLDVLLNFSRDFLPAQVGGLMDAPLLIQPVIIPREVQRQAHNFDVAERYPLAFYEASLVSVAPQSLEGVVEVVRNRLNQPHQFTGFRFTHPTDAVALKRARSSYSILKSLAEKLERQIDLALRIRAVDPDEVVASVLRTHLLPDVMGNMRAYTSQSFRCKACGVSYRRFPLKGRCLTCGGDLQGAVTRASVEKYLFLGLKLCERFHVSEYLRRRFELAAEELSLLFPPRQMLAQLELTQFLGAET